MSGGSYDYLETRLVNDLDDLIHGSLDSMWRRVQWLYATHLHEPTRFVAAEFDRLMAALREVRDLAEQMRPLIHAVEWRDSSDWADDQMFEAFEEYALERQPIDWTA